MPEKIGHDKHGKRIAKVIARAGLASRREAENWIAAGRVAVNGVVIVSPALNVRARDRITVDGLALPDRTRTRLFRYHKPRGLVTTHADPQGRDTIFHSLPKRLPRVISIGRLDINTEGLLLLTNDGGLARVLELPATGWLRRYRVRAHGRVTQAALDRLRGGVTIEGVRYGPIEATLDREQGANVWLTFSIREGKNREVRKVLESLGLKVNRLIRLAYGPFELGELGEGAVEEIETASLRKALGPEIIKAANVDFEAPLEDEIRPSHRHPEARARGTREPRRIAGTAEAATLRGPRGVYHRAARSADPLAQPLQDDGESAARDRNDRNKFAAHKKRRRLDRSGGPRPSRPKLK